ncbi:glycosyltransferase [Marinivivus vitaminiproducens]|uniref:glycosyltransferase n=1 Tax=Marinivivus vitaminiproducens TaxID=3035935 RepID=UPI00279C5FB0|nr:glycosyltransferase [Geminicoccaceae bacterium SCSIO 64248]
MSEQSTLSPEDAPARSASAPAISVLVCTYNRPATLAKALAGCLAQEAPAPDGYEVIVADNSPDANARETVQAIAAKASVPVIYLSEPVPSISGARNAAVHAARGAWLAFCDDDEEPTPVWLKTLHATALATGADIVFGPVRPIFEGGRPPAFDPEGRLYAKRLHLPDQAFAPVYGEQGHAASLGAVGTCNVLVRRDCFEGDQPFDPRFGRTGGEDSDFFRRQVKAGRKIHWSEHAVVTEWTPKDRMTLGYMVERRVRESQSHVRLLVKNARSPVRTEAALVLRGLVQAAVWILPAALARWLPAGLAARAQFGYAAGRGKAFWRRSLGGAVKGAYN